MYFSPFAKQNQAEVWFQCLLVEASALKGVELVKELNALGKTSIEKKNVFFRALPELPKPRPPSWPQFGQLGPFFSEVKIQDLKVSLELKILYVLYDILYICNLKNS